MYLSSMSVIIGLIITVKGLIVKPIKTRIRLIQNVRQNEHVKGLKFILNNRSKLI